jgi:uncharacterized protein (TIGR02594 family)
MDLYCGLYKHDATPWCGLTAGYCVALAGMAPPFNPSIDTKSFLWAKAWLEFGRAVTVPEPGDVIVFNGHVSFYERTEGANYICRGGNQSDQVKESPYAISSVLAIRRPIMATLASSAERHTDIVATVFGGVGDLEKSAYDEHVITSDELGCSLPFRFPKGARPSVRVFAGGRSVVCPIVDVGPWNTDDPYWTLGARPQAETGTDHSGRKTNKAGIDLTPAAARALGVPGKGLVDWEFDTPLAGEVLPSHPKLPAPAPATPRVVTLNIDALEALLALVVMLFKKDHRVMTETTTTPAPAGDKPDLVRGLELVLPLILKLLDAKGAPTAIALPAPPALPVSIEPAPAPEPKSKLGFGTGILATIAALFAHQQGVIADPVGASSSIWGLLSFALPIATTVFGGAGGFGIVLKVLSAVVAAKK